MSLVGTIIVRRVFMSLAKNHFFIKISTFNKVISNNIIVLHSINYSF